MSTLSCLAYKELECAYFHGFWCMVKLLVHEPLLIPIRLGYALDTFPAVSQKSGYVLTRIHVSDTFSQLN
jgi:hypothetical protein